MPCVEMRKAVHPGPGVGPLAGLRSAEEVAVEWEAEVVGT
jgi:hypothetical protein